MIKSINEVKNILSELMSSLEQKGLKPDSEILSLIAALQQVFDITEAAVQQKHVLTNNEITDIGEQGLALIDNIVYQLVSHYPDINVHEFGQVALVMASWIINHKGKLTTIQPIVDALAHQANLIQDNKVLSQLSDFMSQVAHTCSDVLKQDLDNSNPNRPWRVLNLNRGIVATRSLDVNVMESVFPDLIQSIPMDAPGFFKEGMSEMVRLNYPEPICNLMQQFHDKTKLPAVH